jgi:hypothetical protein
MVEPSTLRRAAIVLAALAAAACSVAIPTGNTSIAPNAGARLELQPDVVVVSGGGDAIRSYSSDGLTWTLKGGAPGLDRLAVGKVAFVTGDAAGRVRSIRPVGADTEVMLDPVGLGEIIRNGELSSGPAPIPLANPRVLVAPDLPGTVGGGDDSISRMIPGLALVVAHSGAIAAAPSPKPPPKKPTVHLGAGTTFDVLCCDTMVGALVHYDAGNLRIAGGMWYRLASPTVSYHALFKDGLLSDGDLAIHGLRGVHFEITAADLELVKNVEETYLLPVEFKFPVQGLAYDAASGEPMEGLWLGVLQMWDLRSIFSARTGSVLGSADYDFDSDQLRVSGSEGDLVSGGPRNITIRESLLNSITGVSPGVTRVEVGMTIRWCLCYGALMGDDGLFNQLTTNIDLTNDSAAVSVLGGHCRGAAFQLINRVGLGYSLFPGYVKALNAVRVPAGQGAALAHAGDIHPPEVLLSEAFTEPAGIKRCT